MRVDFVVVSYQEFYNETPSHNTIKNFTTKFRIKNTHTLFMITMSNSTHPLAACIVEYK